MQLVIVGLVAVVAVLVVSLVVVMSGVANRNADSSVSATTFVPSNGGPASIGEPPRVGVDHWHVAYGVWVCGMWEPLWSNAGPDRSGIHTHDDGLIHIHPFSESSAGANAKLGRFAEQVGAQFVDDAVTLPEGKLYRNGDGCAGAASYWTVTEWDVDDPSRPPRIINAKIAEYRFEGDRRAITISFGPINADAPQPWTLPNLDDVSDPRPGATRRSPNPGPTPPMTPIRQPRGFDQTVERLEASMAKPVSGFEPLSGQPGGPLYAQHGHGDAYRGGYRGQFSEAGKPLGKGGSLKVELYEFSSDAAAEDYRRGYMQARSGKGTPKPMPDIPGAQHISSQFGPGLQEVWFTKGPVMVIVVVEAEERTESLIQPAARSVYDNL